jgi:hypothetical protein
MDALPDWLIEVLHIVKGLADGEHQGPMRVLTAGHAQYALEHVPDDVLRAAGVQSAVARP